MGGKKRLTIKQMEKMQQKKKDEKRERSGGTSSEKKLMGIVPLDPRSEKVISALKKMKVLTPYAVATRFNLRLSVAKHLLNELAQRGIIEYVSGGKRLRIYRPVD